MKTWLIASLAVAATLGGACSPAALDTPPPEDPDLTLVRFDRDIDQQEDPVIRRSLAAIDQATAQAERIIAGVVREVLDELDVAYDFPGLEGLPRQPVELPQPGRLPGCPYVGPGEGSSAEARSCRFLTDEMNERALVALAQLDANAELPEAFAEGDGQIAEYRTWYATAVASTLEATMVLLGNALRAATVCDVAPAPAQSARERGVAVGRLLFAGAVNARLRELGVDFDYPDGGRPAHSVRSCRGQILNHARRTLLDGLDARVEPLCRTIGELPVERSPYQAEYLERARDYAAGIPAGIEEEFRVANRILRNRSVCMGSPLVLDLDGDGVELGGQVEFDLGATGEPVRTSWPTGGDAFLALDRDGDGAIGSGAELFGDGPGDANGFDRLARHDDHRDGRIDRRDAVFRALRLWVDADADGRSAPGELHPLPTLGVAAIELDYHEQALVDRRGNQLRQAGRFLRTADRRAALGSTGAVVDVWLVH